MKSADLNFCHVRSELLMSPTVGQEQFIAARFPLYTARRTMCDKAENHMTHDSEIGAKTVLNRTVYAELQKLLVR